VHQFIRCTSTAKRYFNAEHGERTLIKSIAMPGLSTARKIGVLARVASKYAGRSRTFAAVNRAGRATVAHWGRILGQLWLEVTGFVFLALAAIGAIAFLRELGKFQAGTTTSGRVVIAIVFTVLFGWFGLSSFWRVKKKG
jgi:hypothetical protein